MMPNALRRLQWYKNTYERNNDMHVDPSNYINDVIDIAMQAGEAIMPFHKTKEVTKHFSIKEDKSPVTSADLAANELIVNRLAQLADFPILSEESDIPDFVTRQQWDVYWLVDPLDGTKEFIRGSDFFTVNIALIVGQEPVLGVIVSPVTQACYYTCKNAPAYEQLADGSIEVITVAKWDQKRHLNIYASRRHDNKDVNHVLVHGVQGDITRMGSSIKFCHVAKGDADFYPRFGPTCEWDTGAGQIIVECAGGKVVDKAGNRLQYNTKESLINPHFMAVGDYKTISTLWR